MTTLYAYKRERILNQVTIYELEISKSMKTVELFYKQDGTETKE
jgi:hypothetical protein